MLVDNIKSVPIPFDPEAAARLMETLSDQIETASPSSKALLKGVGGCSPYLSRLLISLGRDLNFIFNRSMSACLEAASEKVLVAGNQDTLEAQLETLRAGKKIAAAATALNEVSGAVTTMDAAAALSGFADAAMTGAFRAALNSIVQKGFKPEIPDTPEVNSGIAIIAMGKLGACELNYSSDIDLIVVFDPDAPALNGDDAQYLAVTATKRFVQLMQEQTKDGYVFRTDLRLRPDPGVSAAAISIHAAETYYEAHGQNWERAAFIKARAAAGDIALGERFLRSLRPFVWRKYLDFAAIEDINSISKQIHAAKGGGRIGFLGHNLKVGAGGIREIEFLAQTQQLIMGGKRPELRCRKTLEALEQLEQSGHISDLERDDLQKAYIYFRQVEHRIQMINDQQSHSIPTDPADAARLAAFLGEPGLESLERKTTAALETTHNHFAALFHHEDRLHGASGSLSFTGVENNPDTLQSLKAMGFENPETVGRSIRHWHAGAINATRTARARELFTKLTPKILESLSQSSDPDQAFAAFSDFLERLPSGVQIFSLFAHSPEVFGRLIQIMTISPYLGRSLAKRRHIMESLLEPFWPQPISSADAFRDELDAYTNQAETFEDKLNAARRWAGEAKFNVSAQLVSGAISHQEAARGFSAIADAAITVLTPVAQSEIERKYGLLGGELTVIGLGRLGDQQMTATSDIDLIFVYDAPSDAPSTKQTNAINETTYFARLVRRIVSALTAHTEEGAIYQVDMQLRPSGGAGPTAVSKSAFVKYFEQDAWTWEVMALTKARVIYGRGPLASFVTAEIGRILERMKEASHLERDVHEMRQRLLRSKPTQNLWDMKNANGALTDVEFLHQLIQLKLGRRIDWAEFQTVVAPIWKVSTIERLLSARELFESIVQTSRAATGGVYIPMGSGLALKERMSEACGMDSLESAESLIAQVQRDVKKIYADLVERPAGLEG